MVTGSQKKGVLGVPVVLWSPPRHPEEAQHPASVALLQDSSPTADLWLPVALSSLCQELNHNKFLCFQQKRERKGSWNNNKKVLLPPSKAIKCCEWLQLQLREGCGGFWMLGAGWDPGLGWVWDPLVPPPARSSARRSGRALGFGQGEGWSVPCIPFGLW